MNTAGNQRLTAKLAEIYPFKRTQRLSEQAGPSKEALRGDLQFYTDSSSWQWYTLDVDLTKVWLRGGQGCAAVVLVGALVVANVLIQAFAIVLGCTDSKTSAQSMTATL